MCMENNKVGLTISDTDSSEKSFYHYSFLFSESDMRVFAASPQASLTPLNSTAVFACSATSDLVEELLWEVDGGQTSFPVYAQVLRDRGLEWSMTDDRFLKILELTVLASIINNETEIKCVAFTTSGTFIKTAAVHLTVYGKLVYSYIQNCSFIQYM